MLPHRHSATEDSDNSVTSKLDLEVQNLPRLPRSRLAKGGEYSLPIAKYAQLKAFRYHSDFQQFSDLGPKSAERLLCSGDE